MILSDRDIKKRLDLYSRATGAIEVDPAPALRALQPASLELRLSPHFRVFRNDRYEVIDPREKMERTDLVTMPEGKPYYLEPGGFVLGSTIETVGIPNDLVARVEGKSSLGRMGLLVHATAGYIDPGFYGTVTLELHNVASTTILCWPGDYLCQLSFVQMTSQALRPYGSKGLGSHYLNQSMPEEGAPVTGA